MKLLQRLFPRNPYRSGPMRFQWEAERVLAKIAKKNGLTVKWAGMEGIEGGTMTHILVTKPKD